MMPSSSQVITFSPGKSVGASPADSRYYVLVLFDVSDAKKYRLLVKALKKYCTRIQKSVFEGQLKQAQIKKLTESIGKLMSSSRYFDPNDNVMIYRIASNCDVTVFGRYESTLIDADIFI